MLFYIFSFISEPITEIVGGPDLFINKGGIINLTCVVSMNPEPPAAMIWSHEHRVSLKNFHINVNKKYTNIEKMYK